MTTPRIVTEMESYTGKYVDLLDPKPGQICLADIAVGLANACRFGGQVSRWYSVAEHSVRCAEALNFPNMPGLRSLALAALFHDAHEAYTGDITAPMKRVLGHELKALQHRLDRAIAKHFGLDAEAFRHHLVKDTDAYMLFREAAGLKYSHGVGEHWGNTTHHEPLVAYGWSPAEAEAKFIHTYRRLSNG